jgi:hypothetical protein
MTASEPQHHESIDQLVRASRPVAPARLAEGVMAQLAARRRHRVVAVVASAVAIAAVVTLVLVRRSPDIPAVASSPNDREVAAVPIVDAPPAPVAVPPDAMPSGWADMRTLLAELERTQRAAIAECARLRRGSAAAPATFWIARYPDGTSQTSLVIHHSIGYLGYSAEERCLQKLAKTFALPPLPEGIESISFLLTAAMPKRSHDPSTWRDPRRDARELVARISPALTACVPAGAPLTGSVVIRQGVTGRPRLTIVLGSKTTAAIRRCLDAAAAKIEAPELPDYVSAIQLALSP